MICQERILVLLLSDGGHLLFTIQRETENEMMTRRKQTRRSFLQSAGAGFCGRHVAVCWWRGSDLLRGQCEATASSRLARGSGEPDAGRRFNFGIFPGQYTSDRHTAFRHGLHVWKRCGAILPDAHVGSTKSPYL